MPARSPQAKGKGCPRRIPRWLGRRAQIPGRDRSSGSSREVAPTVPGEVRGSRRSTVTRMAAENPEGPVPSGEIPPVASSKTSPRFEPWRLDDGSGESEVLASKTATRVEAGPGCEPFERARPHPSSWERDRIGGARPRDRARPQCRCHSALPPRPSPSTEGGARLTVSPGSSMRPSATPADGATERSSLGSIDVVTVVVRPRPGAGAVVVVVDVPGAFEAGAPDGTATPPSAQSVGAIARLEAAREPAPTARRARAARFPGGQPRRKVIRPHPLRGDDSASPRRPA